MHLCLFPAVVLVLCHFVPVPLAANERVPLWPEGRIPFLAEGGEGAERPALFAYRSLGSPGHTGAAVVICPGGGYGALAADHEGHQIAEWLLERGVSAYVLHYRLGSEGYHHPVQLAEVQRAIRAVRARAEEDGLDPGRVAVMGFSAGGHLASLAATLHGETVYEPLDETDALSARPDLAILCYPVITMEEGTTHAGSRRNLLGPERAEDEAYARLLSSERNVSAETPPTFLFHTDEDAAVPAENALRFYLALREHGVPAELHSFESGPHGVGLFLGDPVLGAWSELLERWLRSRFFFAPSPGRVPIRAEVSLDGVPVSWGSLTFQPDDPRLPPTTIRLRRGRFAVEAESGPVATPSTVRFEGSIWEETRAPEDRRVRLETLAPEESGPLRFEGGDSDDALVLEFRSR